jgi:hypothetical protein
MLCRKWNEGFKSFPHLSLKLILFGSS